MVLCGCNVFFLKINLGMWCLSSLFGPVFVKQESQFYQRSSLIFLIGLGLGGLGEGKVGGSREIWPEEMGIFPPGRVPL